MKIKATITADANGSTPLLDLAALLECLASDLREWSRRDIDVFYPPYWNTIHDKSWNTLEATVEEVKQPQPGLTLGAGE
jgi:hypothetical protein